MSDDAITPGAPSHAEPEGPGSAGRRREGVARAIDAGVARAIDAGAARAIDAGADAGAPAPIDAADDELLTGVPELVEGSELLRLTYEEWSGICADLERWLSAQVHPRE